jgi:phage terminase large subunit-like protein
MGMRENPHSMVITTAGFDQTLPCYTMRNDGIQILNNIIEHERLFVAIYELDEKDDWKDINNAYKSSPNLGVTVNKEWLQEQIETALARPSEEVNVRTKNLNQWLSTASAWIPSNFLDSINTREWIDTAEEDIVHAGVDLGSVSDLTSVAFLRKIDDIIYIETRYYLPRLFKESENRMKYIQWNQHGYLTFTEGNTTDYNYITNDIKSYGGRIWQICYDPYNATQWALDISQYFRLQSYSQSLASFSRPTKEMERLVLSGKVVFKYNPIDRFCFENVLLKSDWNANIKPVKDNNSIKKIDGVIASIMALASLLLTPSSDGTI